MKNKFNRKIAMMVAILVTVIAFSRCSKDVGDFTRPLPAIISFHNDVLPIFSSNCSLSGCHAGSSPSANLNLSSGTAYTSLFARHEVDTITPTNSMLYIRMHATANPMPASGKLSNYDIAVVLKWIQQKAKNN